jgi:NADH-ubiquinone oxidoreductase chain 5
MINLIALDMLMSIGFFAVFSIFGSLNYSEVFSLVPYLNEVAITIIALFLLGGALAKSANIPLHSWLPGSMGATRSSSKQYGVIPSTQTIESSLP